jgi:hypothetical protein
MTPIERAEVVARIADLERHVKEDLTDLKASVEGLRKDLNGRLRVLELWRARWEGITFAHRWMWPVLASVAGAVVGSGMLLAFGGGLH